VFIYAKGSCSVGGTLSEVSTGLTGVSVCTKERLVSSVAILQAWSYITDPKEVMNTSESDYFPVLRSSDS
jgi:hypothetical protein